MNYTSISDSILLSWMKNGDEAAFQEIYVRHWKRLYVIARSKLQPSDMPEDVIQDLFIKLWENRQELQIDNLSAYLFTALRYAIINRYKSRLTQEKYVVFAQSSSSPAYGTEEQIEYNELLESLEKQIEALPEKTRQIFRLNRLEYKSVKEIAQQLVIPERTIEYHINLAQKLLRPLLQDYFITFLLFLLF